MRAERHAGANSRFSQLFERTKNEYNAYIKIQPVPRSKHSVSIIKTSQLMLYREIIAVCSEIHTKHINTLCGQNVELLNVKLVVHIVTTGLWMGSSKWFRTI
jgi:hypothetical protein